jgi:hypothetical protein
MALHPDLSSKLRLRRPRADEGSRGKHELEMREVRTRTQQAHGAMLEVPSLGKVATFFRFRTGNATLAEWELENGANLKSPVNTRRGPTVFGRSSSEGMFP